ncbi:MAG: Unknown protein [uncultured Sulfurovum sp.]|uniref:Uncharacterized protein n=1 Tax=uncultured Sulfurovum sp. TaxID=269237 RepID=A0A6S6S2D1_9BACT|nr:MAG: Unknown protein [uncultured Sulfurovum sp.]
MSSVAVASLVLVGCGGGSSTTSTSTGTGFYVDAAIQGVDYTCGTQAGLTDSSGKFTFDTNQGCIFKVGNVLLREVNASTLSNGMTIFEDNADTARYLQTLDTDGDATNGIDVSSSAKKLPHTTIPTDNAVLQSIQSDLSANDADYNGRVVSPSETQTHLTETRNTLERNGNQTQYGSLASNEQTKAYFGDTVNNVVVIVDVEKMSVIEKVSTGHSITYAAEEVKIEVTGNTKSQKFYIDNRGSNAIDVLDGSTNTITKTITLDFYPRSIDVRKNTGLVVVSGKNKSMGSVIDGVTDTVLLTVGDTNLTTSTGHPAWINDNHFALVDRENQNIATYKIVKNADTTWNATLVNKLATPSPVHNLIPPELHGQQGREHNGANGTSTSSIFYATAEGTSTVNGAVLKLEFVDGIGLAQLESLEIAPVSGSNLTASDTGVHHHNFLADQKTIYVGSKEGTVSIVDYSTTPMSIVKTITAGKGAGHTAELKHKNIAVVINHTDKFVTLMNTLTHTKIADIQVSNIPDSDVGVVQTQSHPEYHFSKDGRYFYLFLTEEAALVKVDLTTNTLVQRLDIGGKIPMGSFVSSKDKTNHN